MGLRRVSDSPSRRDYHGFGNPRGLRVGYGGVRVRVAILIPSPNPYPQDGLAGIPRVFLLDYNFILNYIFFASTIIYNVYTVIYLLLITIIKLYSGAYSSEKQGFIYPCAAHGPFGHVPKESHSRQSRLQPYHDKRHHKRDAGKRHTAATYDMTVQRQGWQTTSDEGNSGR